MSFSRNKEVLVNTIQKKIFEFDVDLFDYLDFEDDFIFLEPLLFSWFKKEHGLNMTLEQILFGYMNIGKTNIDFDVYSDESGIIYLPNYGYLHSRTKGRVVNFNWVDGEILLNFEGVIIPYRFESLKKIDETISILHYNNDLIKDFIEISPYELYLPDHPLHHLYSDDYRYSIDKVIIAEVNTSRIHYLHNSDIEKALKIIKKYDVGLYTNIKASNRFVFPFENKLVRSFTNPASLGGIYLSTSPSDGLIYYIEEIIHQGSHNYLDILMLNREEFFKVDTERMMGDFSGSLTDHRTLFDAFHGLYTVAKRAGFFKLLLNHRQLFNDQERYEFLARFIDLRKRWQTGIESLDHDAIFTLKGFDLYNELMSICEDSFEAFDKKYPDLVMDMSNQPVNFSYFHFINSNPKC